MSESGYDQIRARVEKRFKERQAFLIHLSIYIFINLVLWGMWFIVPQAAPAMLASALEPGEIEFFMLPWPLIVTLGWGIGLVSHFLSYYYKYGAGAEQREQAIQREVDRELARRDADGYIEKPKRDRRVHLTEDGELETVVETDEGRSRRERDRY